MANALIGWTNKITAAVALTAGSAAASLPATNLQNDSGSPASAWQTAGGVVTAAAGATLLVDSGSPATAWRAFLLARTNLTSAATLRWQVGPVSALVEETPLFDLHFDAGSITPPAGYNFVRSTVANSVNAAGALVQSAANTLRFSYDPVTHACRGALLEESRTNCVRNPRAEGSTAGTIGSGGVAPTNWTFFTNAGITAAIVGTGTEDGVPYVEIRYSGTTTGTATASARAEPTNYTAAASGQVWTYSQYTRLVAGSFGTTAAGPYIGVYEYNAANGFVAGQNSNISSSGAALITQRTSTTRTMSGGAATAFVGATWGLTYGTGVAVDFTVRVGAPQLEQAPTVSSPMLPPIGSPAAFTRGADRQWLSGQTIDAALGLTALAEFTAQAGGTAIPVPVSFTPAGTAFTDSWYLSQNTSGVVSLTPLDSVHGNYAPAMNRSTTYGGPVRAAFSAGASIGAAVATDATGALSNPAVPASAGVFTLVGLGGGAWGATPASASGVLYLRRVAVYAKAVTVGQVAALAITGSSIEVAARTYDSGAVSAGVVAGYGQSVIAAPAAAAGQFCRLDIDDPTNPDGFINVPLAYAGPVWQPTGNASPATVQGRDDATSEFVSRGGQEYPVSFWQRRRADVDFQSIRNAEVWPNVDAFDQAARLGGNCLWIPDPDSADKARAAVFGRAKATADLSYYQNAPDRRAWRVRFTERL